MLDLIVLILIIVGIRKTINKAHMNKDGSSIGRQHASARPNQPRQERQSWDSPLKRKKKETDTYASSAPRRKVSVQNIQERGQDIMNKVNQHIYGTDASKADLMLYKNYLEVERRTDIKKMARDMECTMYQVISDIKDFQKMGYFSNVIIDDSNYVIQYKDTPVRERAQESESYSELAAKTNAGKRPDPIRTHEEHASASVSPMNCEDCGTAQAVRKKTNPYMTMPEHGMEIGYMTMTSDYTVSYMTMPDQGMEIGYNTMPEFPEE